MPAYKLVRSKLSGQDLTGMRFGKLTVIKFAGRMVWPSGCHEKAWMCRCDCGKRTLNHHGHLLMSGTRSCGCILAELKIRRTHGMASSKDRHPIYSSWANMIQRCKNRNSAQFQDYGGRGIKVCRRWKKFENFNEDMEHSWSMGLTLERKNVNRGYSKSNCRWATRKEQAANTRRVMLPALRPKLISICARQKCRKCANAFLMISKMVSKI